MVSMNFLSSSDPAIPNAYSESHPTVKPTAPGISRINSASSSCSPTSTTSSHSFFDSPPLEWNGGDRRQSAESSTSWGSMNEAKPPDDEQDMDADPHTSDYSPPLPHSLCSSETLSFSSSLEHTVTTPEMTHSNQFPNFFASFPSNASPSSSTTSTAPSKGENTPRAEIPPPVWPLSITSPRKHDYITEPSALKTVDKDDPMVTPSRNTSLRRDGSWRRKYASLDTPPTAPHLDPTFPSFTSLRHTPPFAQAAAANNGPANEASFASWPNAAHPDARRHSTQSTQSGPTVPSGSHIVAESPTTGCYISAPIQPPKGYPLPSLHTNLRRESTSGLAPSPSSSSASTHSSASSRSKSRSPQPQPPPPKWARPPCKSNSISGRALSFGSSQERPDINFDDFDPELLEGAEDEWIEIMKGAEGRIAIKSTPAAYDIMVWLPGFSLDNITIATRGHRTVHIVADQWDEGDHAQWDIKLGEDANLKSVNAKFTGKELRVIVAREQRRSSRSNASYRSGSTSSSARSAGGSFSAPSITATVGHSSLDGAPQPLPQPLPNTDSNSTQTPAHSAV